MQNANVGHGEQKVNKMLRREELMFVRSSSWCDAKCWWKNKSGEEVKKKQRIGMTRQIILVANRSFKTE
jgi:hypothetical protein